MALAAIEGWAVPQQAHGMGAQGESGGPVVRQYFLRHLRCRQLHRVIEVTGGLSQLVPQQGPGLFQGHDLPLGLVAVAAQGPQGIGICQRLHVAPVQGSALAQFTDLAEGGALPGFHDALCPLATEALYQAQAQAQGWLFLPRRWTVQ